MIYVIGESPGNSLRHDTSRRLAKLMGVDEATMLQSVVWINLYDTPGTAPRLTAEAIERSATRGDAILLLGRRVAVGWLLDHLQPFDTVRRDDGPVIIAVPHPSGRNRWWNDPDHVADANLALSTVWMRYGRTR